MSFRTHRGTKKSMAIFPHDPSRRRGIRNTALSSFFLGWAPILGKLAYAQGVTPFSLAALRTLVAVLLLWTWYLLFRREWLTPLRWGELVGCIAVGTINGIGSLLYYSGLSRLDASLASFLNTLYLLWVVLFLAASGQPVGRITLLRIALAIGGVYLLTGGSKGEPNWLGAMLMVASAATFGWHLVMGQWLLADTPSQAATPYILTAMAATVGLARVLQGRPVEPIPAGGWGAIIALGATTAISRLLMFAGLRRLGGIETALISLLELIVSLGLAFLLLGERMTPLQWAGGIVLVGGILLGALERSP
ncbi:MAG: DMT family transporter [Anaerolineae bacterium]